MQLTTSALILALAGAVAAQTTCAAQGALDACTAQYKPQLAACANNDWSCMCDASTNLLTCYHNCPSDPGQSSVQSQNTQYCTAAKAYSSSSSSGGMSMTGGSGGASAAATATSAYVSPTLPAGVTASASETSAVQTGGGEAVATASTINGSGTGAGSNFGPSVAGLVVMLAGAVVLL